jgi:hypothetical protein
LSATSEDVTLAENLIKGIKAMDDMDDDEMVAAGILYDPGKGTEEALNLKVTETIHKFLGETPRVDREKRHQITGMEDHGCSGIFIG